MNEEEKNKEIKRIVEDSLRWLKEMSDRWEKEDVLREDPYRGCDHGIVFDEERCNRESPDALAVRRLYPRLEGACPKGCGFVGIGYASYAHYLWGDW